MLSELQPRKLCWSVCLTGLMILTGLLGARNSATMVTAILPSLTDESSPPEPSSVADSRKPAHNPRDSVALSMESEVTITPERYYGQSRQSGGNQLSTEHTDVENKSDAKHKPSTLAGYVGLFTGCGALVALLVFLPLPNQFGHIKDVTNAEAVVYSFYVVGAVSLLVAVFVGFGLRNIRGEEGKGWRLLLGLRGANPDGTGAENDSRAHKVCKTPYSRLWLTKHC